jgi:hypothetical protein
MMDKRHFCMMGNTGMSNGSLRMRAARTKFRTGVAAALVSMALAGCSTKKDVAAPVDPNVYPANYRTQIMEFLRQSLTTRADFRGALIAPPVLKPIGDSQHYMVCVQFSGNSQLKTKVAIYFAGMLTQFIDATPEQCGDAAYQPFKELGGALPPGN